MTNRELMNIARYGLQFSYAPYSGFKVGAALVTKSGKVYTGCNIENASYGATNCAERTAIFKAVSEGEREFSKLAICSSGGDFTYPCGMCRQVICEFVKPKDDFLVILENAKGDIKELTISELLPFAFDGDSL